MFFVRRGHTRQDKAEHAAKEELAKYPGDSQAQINVGQLAEDPLDKSIEGVIEMHDSRTQNREQAELEWSTFPCSVSAGGKRA